MQICHFQCSCLGTQRVLTLLLLPPGETLAKQHCEGGSSAAGQSSLLTFPMVFFFPESKWAKVQGADRYQACIQVRLMCNKCLWVETCPGACNKPWEGERWGERWCGACRNASFYALTEKTNHMDRPCEWPAELTENRRTSHLKVPLEIGRKVVHEQHEVCETKPLKKRLSAGHLLSPAFHYEKGQDKRKGKEGKSTEYFLLYHRSPGAELVTNFIMCKKELLTFLDCLSPRFPGRTPIISKSIKSPVTSAGRLESKPRRQ